MTSLDKVLSKPPTEIEAGLVSTRDINLDDALQVVREAGYVAIKSASYRRAQERQRIAEALREDAANDAEHARSWACDCLTEERRLRDRLTFVYGVAMAHGATREELASEAFPRSFSTNDEPASDS